jgi:3-deoxy-D-manno-octulosonic acid kinase
MSPTGALRDPVLSQYTEVVANGARGLIRRGYEGEAAFFRAGPVVESHAGSGVSGGRAAHPVVRLSGGELALLRGFRRGGLLRYLNRDRYFVGHRAWAELRATEHARRGGVRAPVVLAAVERPQRVGYTASLATLWIEDAVDLLLWLAAGDAGAGALALREFGRQVGRMHAAGVAHPDLTLRNVLVRGSARDLEVYLLDFDRARIFAGPVPPGRRARDLRRFARSARKLGARLGSTGWGELRGGYGTGWPATLLPG